MKRKLDERDVPTPVKGQPAAAPTPSFESFGLDDRLLRALVKARFSTPTPIQAQAIPPALQGKDVVDTGSGKTVAYLLPLLQSILQQKQTKISKHVSALVLVPSKELAQQVHEVTRSLCAFCEQTIRSLNLSERRTDDAKRVFLADAPDVIVATPKAARTAATLKLDQLTHVVIDEADRMLDYDNEDDLKNLAPALPEGAQKVLMSATMESDVEKLKGIFFQDPVVLDVKAPVEEGEKVTQYYVECGEAEKFVLLYIIFKLRIIKGKSIVFVDSVDRCYRLKLYLEQFGIRSCILNPELPVNSRIHAVDEFNKNVYDIIIGSDERAVLGAEDAPGARKKAKKSTAPRDTEYGIARGLDFRNVSCVFNFDLPADADSYTHRIGRTARAGATGYAFSFAVPAAEHGKHKHTTIPSTQHDEAVLAAIIAAQTAQGKTLQPYVFGEESVKAFRYRAGDALKQITRTAIRAARTRELKTSLLASTKLARHFEENPDELRHLRHDGELRAVQVQTHLKHVPDYMLPKTSSSSASKPDVGFVPFAPSDENQARKERRSVKRRGGSAGRGGRGGRGRADPLRTFSARGRGRK